MKLSLPEQGRLPIFELNDLQANLCGQFQSSKNGVSVRAYPFPFKAAFTVSNDCDSMNFEAFFDWHGFVNGRKATHYGDGLDLEIGDSFWTFAGNESSVPSLHRHFAYDADYQDSADIGQIVEYARAGWFDTLHSLGNWGGPNSRPDWKIGRDQALYALDRLDALGIKPTVYTNHSRSPANVGAAWGYYQIADDPEREFYFLDKLREFGIRYYWLDVLNNIEKFGDYLNYSSNAELQVAIANFDWPAWMRRRRTERELAELLELNPKEKPAVAMPIELPDDAAIRKEMFVGFFNKTLNLTTAKDGSRIQIFKRQRGYDQPVASTFCMQVTSNDLDQLIQMGGAAIIYQHFGVQGPRGRSPVTCP